MADQWSRLGRDLFLEIDKAHGLRSGLEEALRDAIRRAQLAAGTALPSSRALARDLGVARGTVSQAYEQLIAEGYLVSTQRSATRVAPLPARQPGLTQAEAEVGATTLASLYRPPAAGADLRPGRPDLSMFPRRQWLAATRRVLQTTPNTALGEAGWAGCAELRTALAGYLGRARGVVTSPDRIIVCAGFTHALWVVCQILSRYGTHTISFEDPFEPDYRTRAERVGLSTACVPVDDDGLMVDQLADQPVVVTPAHQYPLGVTMSPRRRTQLVGWARQSQTFVVEDDYDGEFRYDRQPVGALQGLAPDRVIYAGTTSKTMTPGLRIGWLVVPADLIRPLHDVMRGEAAHVSVIDQLVLADLIQTGELDRHLRQCRSRYRRRRDRLGDVIAQLAHAQLSGIAAGLHAVVRLPAPSTAEARVLALLADHGVAADGLSRFYRNAADPPSLGIVLGYATPPEHSYDGALNALVEALHEYESTATSR
jgi:GntR family transcriptional regulator / MocR family aminotransferase